MIRTTLPFLVPLSFVIAADHAVAQRRFKPIDEPRSIDGSGNHLVDTDRGAALTPLVRLSPVAYEDGVNAPSGASRANARVISNAVNAQSDDLREPTGLSDLFWQWGQFLDHDITETPIHDPAEPFPIEVPVGDPWFDPTGMGGVVIPLSRSFPVREGGVREQVNAITAWIDASQVYGSDAVRANALRTNDGTGRLRTSEGNLLPYNTDGLPNAPSDHLQRFFLAGDVRANEQVGLTALHVLFVREHNYWADRIADEANGGGHGGGHRGGRGGGRSLSDDEFRSGGGHDLTGDQIYELARAIVSAEMQLVTYREWLPLLLGHGAVGLESTYRPELDGSIRNEFATAAFRLGHSMLSPTLQRLDEDGQVIASGHLSLADAFFAPQTLVETGIDPLLRGLVTQRAQRLDVFVVDDVRNFLFGPPGAGGLDLASLNVQRGRDHGMGSYADVRRALGLGAPVTFDEITSDSSVANRLAQIAASPEDLDLWVAGLAEDRVPGAIVGPTFHSILTEQFRALRDGDRLWYSRQLRRQLVELVERQSMSAILRRNSGLSGEFVSDPFRAQP